MSSNSETNSIFPFNQLSDKNIYDLLLNNDN